MHDPDFVSVLVHVPDKNAQISSIHKLYLYDCGYYLGKVNLLCYNNANCKIEVAKVCVCYKKLWKLLIDRDMKKKDLQEAAGLSSTTVAKLSNHENVSMEVLIKVCTTLGVDFGDIMELLPEQTGNIKSDIVQP